MARLLLVDDDILVSGTIALVLEDAGHEVQVAHDGVGAFRLFKTAEFDLVIADFRMPFADGASLVDMIRNGEYRNDVPVIIMSGAVPREEALDKLNVQAFIGKPFQTDDFISTVSSLLPKPEGS